ncbi:MAG: T9SS type A sorting domain-containing protein [Bacteroidia bacterium]|nr:T9SS type A sorting domain-containing protein [Bacteroidia bacterium]
MKKILYSLLFFLFCITTKNIAQTCSSLNFQLQANIPSTCNNMVMTMMHDQNNQPYLYVANKEAGLKVYNISTITSPTLVATIPTTQFDTLDVMNLSQQGNYLYLALGNTFTNPQKGGMAIIDVSTPSAPSVTDYYVVPGSTTGGGIVKAEGNYAYLGAMQSGLVILDITNKSNIQLVSQFIPSINFPPVASPNPNLYNARGMEVKNSIVYLCYDAGGIRIINCVNKNAPVETGRWCNPVMYSPMNHPKAYNNIVLDDSLAYVAVDYAGMEVLDLSDTSAISMTGWWNPYNAPNNNWFTSPSHTNEIVLEKDCNRVFMSTGKSDMMVIDVSDPTQPDSCNMYGGTANNMGTWGIGLWQNQIYLSYICAVIPFSSSLTQTTILTFNSCPVGINEQVENNSISIYPNPFADQAVLSSNKAFNNASIRIHNVLGQYVKTIEQVNGNEVVIEKEGLEEGVYFVQVVENNILLEITKIIITE